MKNAWIIIIYSVFHIILIVQHYLQLLLHVLNNENYENKFIQLSLGFMWLASVFWLVCYLKLLQEFPVYGWFPIFLGHIFLYKMDSDENLIVVKVTNKVTLIIYCSKHNNNNRE